MKRSVFTVIFVALFCCITLFAGCGGNNQEQTAKAVLTRLYTYPNADLVEFEANLTDDDYEESGSGRYMKPETVERQNQILRDILGEEVEDACAEKLYDWFFTEMMLSSERGYTLTPKDVTLEGENNQYSYTITALYTDSTVTDSEETITGRIQFNDAGKINYISLDKDTHLDRIYAAE